MRSPGRLSSVVDLLDLICANRHRRGQPADKLISEYTRNRRFIGSKDRRWITNAVYYILRHYRYYQWIISQIGFDHKNIRFIAILYCRETENKLDNFFDPSDPYSLSDLSPKERKALEDLNNIDISSMPWECETNVPSFLVPHFQSRYGQDCQSLVRSLQEPAFLDIWLTRPDQTRLPLDLEPKIPETIAQDQQNLMSNDLKIHHWVALPYASAGFRTKVKIQLQNYASYRNGDVEVQDEASQICAHLIGAVKGDSFLDFCAGAGGKALRASVLADNSLSTTALDISSKRLATLEKRFEKAKSNMPEIIRLNQKKGGDIDLSPFEKTQKTFDKVLVDAPCSSSGTWRRNPDLRWHYSGKDLKNFSLLQSDLLLKASRFVKPGGMLIYATCSLYALENEDVVNNFLEDNADFSAVDYRENWISAGLKGSAPKSGAETGPFLQLTPLHHQTDGFFIALMSRLPQ